MLPKPWLAALAAATLCVSLCPAQTSAPASQPAPSLPALLRTIRSSDFPADITEAYRLGRSAFPNNPDLHRSYMRRMLQYGVISLAAPAAERLCRLDAYDGLGWGVQAYVAAKAAHYPAALEHAVLAVRYDTDNPSSLAALGQLLAWRENSPGAPDLAPASQRILDEYRKKVETRPPFKAAYDAVAKSLTESAAFRKTTSDRLAELRAQIKDADTEFRRLGSQLADTDRDIDSTQRRLNSSRFALYNWNRPVPTPPGPTPPPVPTPDPIAYNLLLKAIRDDEDLLRSLQRTHDELVRSREQLRGPALKARAELNQLTGQLAALDKSMAKLFRFEPPAVDGVITPERPTLPGAAPTAVTTANERAERELKLAQLHIDNGRPDLARPKLEALIADFPNTTYSRKASLLLESLPSDK